METVTVVESLAGLTGFLLHLVAAVVLMVVFTALYVRVTPYPEFALIREGKIAPAISLSGALLGFVIPLASAIISSVSLLDMVLWALVALMVQILVYLLLKAFLHDLPNDIATDRIAPALLLAALSLAAGILSAACMVF
jgi:putative membrane protein